MSARGAEIEQLLEEQRSYYRARAGEYEDWWYRRGRYEHGGEADARWFAEVAALERAVEQLAPFGRVLELACGTGLWTQKLAPSAARLVALDASAEVLALAREKLSDTEVELLQADIFAWEPEERFDLVFFSFWLSHVPSELMTGFLEKVGRALAPEGRVFVIDSARSSRASARDHALPAEGEERQRRRLSNGSEYTIVKHWFERDALRALLETHGWRASVRSTGEFFLYAEASPAGSPRGA
jgi:demethylmenaquinone methyltransferase/2-methoxy-6-polyprenyl-1,4-benzoquinol methylase